jgi:hypothetical protein
MSLAILENKALRWLLLMCHLRMLCKLLIKGYGTAHFRLQKLKIHFPLPSIHWTGGCVGPGVGPDTVQEGKASCHIWDSTTIP